METRIPRNKAIAVFPSAGKFISIPGEGAVEVFEAGAAGGPSAPSAPSAPALLIDTTHYLLIDGAGHYLFIN